jgi:hypothetical protein
MVSRNDKEWMKEQLDKLDMNEHTQVFDIVKKYTEEFTKTQTGILVSTASLSNECLEEIRRYINFCLDQRKRMDEDQKTRKTYERMIND